MARFVVERLAGMEGVKTKLVDPRDLPLTNLAQREWEMETPPPELARFVADMARADGFVLVVPEYNHGYPGALKNLLDALYDEWNRKPFAIVGVGGISGGMRMIESLRVVIAGLEAVAIPRSVPVQFVGKTWTPEGPAEPEVWGPRFDQLFDELVWYAAALRAARDADTSA